MKRLDFSEIQRLCADEWVLLAEPIYKDSVFPESAILVYHHKEKGKVTQAALNTKHYFTAIEFTGNIPAELDENFVFVL